MTDTMLSLKGEVALVTGASRGIGKAVCQTLAQRGAVVIGTATSAEGAAAISGYLGAEGLAGRGVALDVTDGDAVEALVAELAGAEGSPGIVVNNAGITRDNLLLRMKDAEWDQLIDTNLKSVFRVSRACLRGMTKARKGRIISITSVVASMGNAGQCNYAAAKAGVAGFTRALAHEVAGRNVTVNAVAPGFIDTDMTRALGEGPRAALLERIPLRRLGQAQDVAEAVAFLAAPAAAYITGMTLHVNGGMYMN